MGEESTMWRGADQVMCSLYVLAGLGRGYVGKEMGGRARPALRGGAALGPVGVGAQLMRRVGPTHAQLVGARGMACCTSSGSL